MLTVQNPKKSYLAKKPACSLVDNVSLGLRLLPSSSGCLSLEGNGLQLASSVQSFVLCAGLAVVAIPQSGLLAQVSFLRLPSGHSGPVLTLSNAAQASLPSPCLLVAGKVSVLLLHRGSYHWAHNLWVLIIYFSSLLCCPL